MSGNVYNWREGTHLITFIVGHKYCNVFAQYAKPAQVFEAVKEWHEETDPDGSMVPFVILNEYYIEKSDVEWLLENELVQVQVN